MLGTNETTRADYITEVKMIKSGKGIEKVGSPKVYNSLVLIVF